MSVELQKYRVNLTIEIEATPESADRITDQLVDMVNTIGYVSCVQIGEVTR